MKVECSHCGDRVEMGIVPKIAKRKGLVGKKIDPPLDGASGKCLTCDRQVRRVYRAELRIFEEVDGLSHLLAQAGGRHMGVSLAEVIDTIEEELGQRWEEVKSLASFADEEIDD